MENIIVIAIIATLVLCAGLYICKAKKRGQKCIGCSACPGNCAACKSCHQ